VYSSSHSSSAEVESRQVKFIAEYASELSFVFHPPSIRAEAHTKHINESAAKNTWHKLENKKRVTKQKVARHHCHDSNRIE